MYPYIRLFKVMTSARFKRKLGYDGESVLKLRVWPWDIDFYPEMNNGRHLTLMDLGRMDMAQRSGLMKVMHENRWGFVVAGASVRFRRKLPPFRKFKLHSQVIGYDERWFYFYQTTERRKQLCSSALIRTGILRKGGVVPAREVMKKMGVEFSPTVPEWVQAWIDADELRPKM